MAKDPAFMYLHPVAQSGVRVAAGFLTVLAMSGGILQAAALKLDPVDEVQGGFVVLRVAAPAGSGSVQALGKTVPLFPVAGGLRGLLPVALETPPGEYSVLAKSGTATWGASLRVRERDCGAPRRLKGLRVNAEAGASLRDVGARFRAVLGRMTARAFWSPVLRQPVPGRVTSRFGTLRFYEGGASWPHRGMDFSWPAGWPVVACAAGVVRLAQPMGLYGNTVVVDHGQTLFTAYLHLSRIEVREGWRVESGQVIGNVGDTGLAKGAHLHFGAYIGTVPIDPEELLSRGLPGERE